MPDMSHPIALKFPPAMLARFAELRASSRSEAIRLAVDRYFALVDAARESASQVAQGGNGAKLRKAFAPIDAGETRAIIHSLPAIVRESCGEELAGKVETMTPAERIALFEMVRK